MTPLLQKLVDKLSSVLPQGLWKRLWWITSSKEKEAIQRIFAGLSMEEQRGLINSEYDSRKREAEEMLGSLTDWYHMQGTDWYEQWKQERDRWQNVLGMHNVQLGGGHYGQKRHGR